MAKIDTFTLNPNDPENTTQTFINVTATVGVNGVNLKDDVMVVQALLKFALESYQAFQGTEFPEPTGTDIKATTKIIKKFQRFYKRIHNEVPIDGRIDPARGRYVYGTKTEWTIFSLNVVALENTLFNGGGNPIEQICKRWPSVREILDESSVGSLGLALE
jgi:hypothetical protein